MIEKKVAIITGAANGIGRATAMKFAANDYAVALVDKDSAGLKTLVKDLEDSNILCINGDLEDSNFISSVVEITVEKWGRIDVLINGAAWRIIETMRSMTQENWEKTLKICLTAPAFLAKRVAGIMEEKDLEGVIINISSVMSERPGGNSPAYVAAKGGIESLTYELANLYGPKGLRVVAVNPGNIETDLSGDYTDEKGANISNKLTENINAMTPLKRSGKPEEVANLLYWLSSKEASFITGTTIVVDGGLSHNLDNYHLKRVQFPKEF